MKETGSAGYFEFMAVDFVRCPYCNEMIGHDDLIDSFDKKSSAVECPYCRAQINIIELRSCLEYQY